MQAHKTLPGASTRSRARLLEAAFAGVLALIGSVAAPGAAAQTGQLSEQDFLEEIPRVISASRLPQAPADSPAAITVIDREMIRASGARNLAELFQLVPGFHWGTPRGGRDVVA